MQMRDILAANIDDPFAAESRKDMAVEKAPVTLLRARAPLRLDVERHEILGHLAEGPHRTSRTSFFDRIGAALDKAENLLGSRARLVGG